MKTIHAGVHFCFDIDFCLDICRQMSTANAPGEIRYPAFVDTNLLLCSNLCNAYL